MASPPRDLREWMRTVERKLTAATRSGNATVIAAAQREFEKVYAEVEAKAPDKRTPAAPVELTVETALDVDANGKTFGRATIDFPDVTKATDGTNLTVDYYELWGRNVTGWDGSGTGPVWTQLATSARSQLSYEPFKPGLDWQFRVRAFGTTAILAGAWSATIATNIGRDTIAPPIPSPLILTARLGTVTIAHNGLGANGAAMPADYDRTEILFGPEPEPVTKFGRDLHGASSTVVIGLPYNVPYYARCRAVDDSGNASAWSAISTVTVTPLVSGDISGLDTTLADQVERAENAENAAELAAADAVAAEGRARDAQTAAETAQGSATAAQQEALDAAAAAAAAESAAATAQSGAAQAAADAENARLAAVAAEADAQASYNDLQTFMNSSGRVLYQEAEPAVEDQSPNNLWIKPSTGETFVWITDTATGTSSWKEVENQDWALAASNAAAAQQAAETARDAATTAEAEAVAAADRATAAESHVVTLEAQAAASKTAADAAAADALAAQNAATAAEDRATEAEAAAVSAEQKADQSFADLQAAIGTSAKIIRQEEAPTGEDARDGVLWIKDSTGESYMWDNVDLIWKVIDNATIRQLALDADAAADRAAAAQTAAEGARTDANAAAGTATTAQQNAAAAQAAAVAAEGRATQAEADASAAETAATTAQANAAAAETRADEAEASAAQSLANLNTYLATAGQIIRQETEPTGDLARTGVLWIKDSTGQSFTYDSVNSMWVEVENEAYAAAAAAADAAADRAEAAEAAAVQAEADALAAQNAAVAAQGTAADLVAQADAAQAAAEAAQAAATTAQGNAAASEERAIAAEGVAIAADETADRAEASALAAANLAAGKGKVYYEPEPPAGDPNGLWLDTDNGNTPHRYRDYGPDVAYDFEAAHGFTQGSTSSFVRVADPTPHSGTQVLRNGTGAAYRVYHGTDIYPRDPRIIYSVWVRIQAGTYMAGVHILGSTGTNGYQVMLDGRGASQGAAQIRKNTGSGSVTKIVLETADGSVTPGEWYRVEAWADATKVYGRIYDAAGTLLGSGSITDSEWKSGSAGVYGYDQVWFDDFSIDAPAGEWLAVTDQNVINAANAADAARDAADAAEAAAVVAKDEATAAKNTAATAQSNAEAAQAAAVAAEGRADTAEANAVAAQQAAVAAEGRATTAEADAAAAAADANQAMNDLQVYIGTSGRVIYQEATPATDDQNVNNLWIVPSTGKSYVWDAADLRWEEVVNQAVAQAAADADAAADRALLAQQAAEAAEADAVTARNAATAAEGRATTAESNAVAARNAATAAETRATDAESAATAAAADADASFAALQTEVGNSGKIIYTDVEPTGDDRNPNNLWIKDSTGEVFAYDTSVGDWVLVESVTIRQMALDADAAADRAEAAEAAASQARTDANTAAGKATTAESNASAAQTAAANANNAAQAAATRADNAETAAEAAQASADQSFQDLQGFLDNAGKVIHQEAEPTGDDRNKNNLWIKDSTGEPYVWDPLENAGAGAWVVVTDQRVVQMAADADRAADEAAASKTAADNAAAEAAQAEIDATNAANAAAGSKTAADSAAAEANQAQAAADAAKLAADAAAADAAEAAGRADDAAVAAGQSSADAVLAKQAAEAAQGAADAAAAAAEQSAINASGKAVVKYQPTAPEPSGDTLWFDTLNGNAPKVWVDYGPGPLTNHGHMGNYRGHSAIAVTEEHYPERDSVVLRGTRSGTGGTAIYLLNTDRPTVVPGTVMTYTFWVRSSVTQTLTMRISWQGNTGSNDRLNKSVPANTWTKFVHTSTVPDGTTYITVDLLNGNTGTVGDWFEFGELTITEGDTALPAYFDGDFPGVDWSGEQYDSPSVYTAPGWYGVEDAAVLAAAAAVVTAQERADEAHQLAGEADDTAKAALNAATHTGKNLFSTNDPSGTAPYGTIWIKHDANGKALGHWQQTGGSAPNPTTGLGGTDGSTWTKRPVTSEMIDNLDVSKLTGLYIDAKHIQASTLTIGGTTLGAKVDTFDTTTSKVAAVTDANGKLVAGQVAGTLPETTVPLLTTAKIPSLDATKVTTGTFGTAVKINDGSINSGISPSKLTGSGTIPETKVPALTEAKIPLLTTAKIPQLATDKVTGLPTALANAEATGSRVASWQATDTTFIDGGKIFTDSIKAGAIDVNDFWADTANIGAVDAVHIKGRAVEAEHIALGGISRENLSPTIDELVPNPKWLDETLNNTWGPHNVYSNNTLTTLSTGGFVWDTNAANLRFGQTKQLKVDGPLTPPEWQTMPLSDLIATTDDIKYYLSLDTFSGDTNFYLTLALFTYDINGVSNQGSGAYFTGVRSASTVDPDREWVTHEAVVTLPPGTAYFYIGLQKPNQVTATGYVMAGRMSVHRAIAGEGLGRRAELSPAGMTLYNAEGSEVVNLTSEPPQFLGILDGAGNTIAGLSDDGWVASEGLNVRNDPEFMGTNLFGLTTGEVFPAEYSPPGILDLFPRGIVARGYRAMAGTPAATNQEREILELSYDRYQNRAYRITVSPWSVYIDGAYGYLKCYYTTDGSRPTMNSNLLQIKTVRNNGVDGTMMDMGTTWYDLGEAYLPDHRRRYLFTFEALNGSLNPFGNTRDGSMVRVWVEDMGMNVSETGLDRTGVRANGGSSPSAPSTVEKQNYTTRWTANGYRSYYTSGGHYTYNSSKMYQGASPAVGGLQSICTFPSMTSALSGATITGVRAYFYFNHWYNNSGGTAVLGMHGSSSLPSTKPSITYAGISTGWPKPGGRWVNIPSSLWAGIKSGAYRGLALGDTSPTTTEYGYANGSSTQIEVKYTK